MAQHLHLNWVAVTLCDPTWQVTSGSFEMTISFISFNLEHLNEHTLRSTGDSRTIASVKCRSSSLLLDAASVMLGCGNGLPVFTVHFAGVI